MYVARQMFRITHKIGRFTDTIEVCKHATLVAAKHRFDSSGTASMLFLVELKHGPDTCIAARDRSLTEIDARYFREITSIAESHSVKIVDGWSFPIGHQLWYVVEAEYSHSVAEVFKESRAFSWNTVSINPVVNHAAFVEKVLNPIVEG